MKKWFIRIVSLVYCLVFLLPNSPRALAYEKGDAFSIDLSSRIHNDDSREYVQMMLDYYIRTDPMVQNALDGGFSAMFLFDGCSDNMRDTALNDLTYYRVSGICLVIQKDDSGQLKLLYFNNNCSTIPDRPLEYGAWRLPKTGDVGPATVCDGTYQMYSVRHKGKYEALNVRTEYRDPLLNAVYMTPDGYVSARASEINIHTRTSNHVSGVGMWSAGCPLVGTGFSWEFWRMMQMVYYTQYEAFELDNFVGTLTIDRQRLRHEMYTLYQSPDAVDMIVEKSKQAQPEAYLADCGEIVPLKKTAYRTGVQTPVMTLPCSNASDARSQILTQLPQGTDVQLQGTIQNAAGEKWYTFSYGTGQAYIAASTVYRVGPLTDFLEKLF